MGEDRDKSGEATQWVRWATLVEIAERLQPMACALHSEGVTAWGDSRTGEDAQIIGMHWRRERALLRREAIEAVQARDQEPGAVALAEWMRQLTLWRVTWPEHALRSEEWVGPSAALAARVANNPQTRGYFQAGGDAQGKGDGRGCGLSRAAVIRQMPALRGNTEMASGMLVALAAESHTMRERMGIFVERAVEAARLLDVALVPAPMSDADQSGWRMLGALWHERMRHEHSKGSAAAERWPNVFGASLGLHSSLQWPATVRIPMLLGSLYQAGFFGGMVLPATPAFRPVGLTSIARVLSHWGRQLAWAPMGQTLPIPLRFTPNDSRPAALGWLLVWLLCEPSFLMHTLGTGRRAAEEEARRHAQVLSGGIVLAGTRAQQWESIVHRVQRQGRSSLGAGDWAEESAGLAGHLWGAAAAGAEGPALRTLMASGEFPWARPSAHAEWGALAEAMALRRSLREHFDEDWFRNPKAVPLFRDWLEAPPLRGQAKSATDELSSYIKLVFS